MLVLFINANKKNEEGKARFKNFYDNIKRILKRTVYFGNEITETIRTFDDLDDYIYDQITFRMDERAKRKFQSLQYIFIDGNHNFAPWSDLMIDVLLIIRKGIEENKKLMCNGFAHFGSYYYLSTKFDKFQKIGTGRITKSYKQADYQYHQQSGDLYFKDKKVCNCGIKIVNSNRPFADKSSNAVNNGIILSSKFDYVVFDSKNGHKIQRNIEVPFTFYWKSKLFCTPKSISQAKVDILYETQLGYPLAFSYKNLISIQGLCSQFLKLVQNWLLEYTQRQVEPDDINFKYNKSYQSLAFQNKIEFKKTLNSSNSFLKLTKNTYQRPLSSKSKFSTIQFQKPAIRCSGKYQTINERYMQEQLKKKQLNIGKSRLNFHGKLDQMEISNYVQRQPSRPASSHKFREVNKEKWLTKYDFLNS